MTHYDSSFDAGTSRTETRSRFEREIRGLGARFCSYVQHLTAEQWMLILVGVIVGMVLG